LLVDQNGIARTESSERCVSAVPVDGRSQELASAEEVAAFQERFLRLLERRTAIYTMGDSSSVPRHVAGDLFLSTCFVLGIDPVEQTVPDDLLSADLEAEFRRRLAEIGRKVELTERLWQEACLALPLIPNVALRDTLASIGEFPKRYEYRSMAHEIPCSIDYPLCHPVPESLLGVEYVNEYLRRLLVEAEFLGRFEFDACVRVLSRSCPDYFGLLINLYEPVATNAVGRALIGEDPRPLDVSEEDRARIAALLGPLGEGRRVAVMREAASSVCDALGIGDDRAVAYLSDLAPELLPRIEVGLARGDLRGVFVSCGAASSGHRSRNSSK